MRSLSICSRPINQPSVCQCSETFKGGHVLSIEATAPVSGNQRGLFNAPLSFASEFGPGITLFQTKKAQETTQALREKGVPQT